MGQRRLFSLSLPWYIIQSFLQACIFTYSTGMGQITLLASYVLTGNSFSSGRNPATSFNSFVKFTSDKQLSALNFNNSSVASNLLSLQFGYRGFFESGD